MIGILTQIVSKARSESSVGDRWNELRSRRSDDDGSGAARGVESNLFACDSCGTVYIAVEKTDCHNCGDTVQKVAKSFEE